MSNVLGKCKQAILSLVNCLTNRDSVHLVVYDTAVDVIFTDFTAENRKEISQKLDEVEARSSTNLMGGIEKGLEVLAMSECVGTKSLFLFSDGLANVGEKDPERIGQRTKELSDAAEVLLTTFGIGEHYDEKLMNSIAKSGSGSYYYIEDMERIPFLMQRGLDGFTRFHSKSARVIAAGKRGSGTRVLSVSNAKRLLRPKQFQIREYAFHQYEVLAGSTGDSIELEVVLQYEALGGGSCEIRRDVSVPLVGYGEFDPDSTNAMARCYTDMTVVSDINNQITEMMKAKAPADRVIAKKREAVAIYEQLLPHDDFVVIEPLLLREREVLEEFETKGVYTAASKKKLEYVAAKAVGYTQDQFDYCEEEESDDDMGFALSD